MSERDIGELRALVEALREDVRELKRDMRTLPSRVDRIEGAVEEHAEAIATLQQKDNMAKIILVSAAVVGGLVARYSPEAFRALVGLFLP